MALAFKKIVMFPIIIGLSMVLVSAAFAGTADTLTTPINEIQTYGIQADSHTALRVGKQDSQAPTEVSIAGEQKIVILFISFPSVPLLSSVTPQLLQATYFGPDNSVDSFLRESSYGKVWATGDVFGPFVLDADYFDQPISVRDSAVRAASAQVDFTKYNRIVLVIPQSSTGLESGGLGSIGSDTVPLYPQGSITASTTWLGDASAGSPQDLLNTACHEMGHNLGLEHARAADFGSEILGPVGVLPAPFDQMHDLGDSFSNMGRGSGHWAAPQKFALGWLKEGVDMQNVSSDGVYVLQPYEAADNGLKVVRVQRGTGNNAWLWLEYRQSTAGIFDSSLPSTAFGGALIHYEDAGWNDTEIHSNLLRFNPDSPGGLFFGNAILTAGSSWSDPYSNLSISIDQNVTSGLKVTVSYAPPPPISLSPATSDVVAPGGQVTINVTAPAGYAWTAVSSVPWMTISSGASGTGNGQITLSVAPTSITSTRWGRVTAGGAAAVVTQDAAVGTLSLSPYYADFPAFGGTGEIIVTSNAPDYSWNTTVNDSWIQSVFFSSLMETGSGTLRYIVAQNTGNTSRTGTIGIGDQVFTVIQDAGDQMISKLDWERLTITDAPMSRMSMDVSFFAGSGDSILFGGDWDASPFNDTWGWNGTAWLNKVPAHNPGNRAGHAMAYDAARDQIVLFGGYDYTAGAYSDSTWIWNGMDWTQVYPQTSPSARTYHAMVYNPDSQKVLLFGGNPDEADTWEWDGTNWSKKSSPTAPPPRDGTAMAYDAARKEVVLFGGSQNVYSGSQQNKPAFFNDTWTWDGTQWQEKVTTTAPSARMGARIEYDPDIGQVVLIGGYGAKDMSATYPYTYVFDYREETWTWDGSNWTQQFPDQSPPFSWNYGMVYDSVHQGFFAFLGDDLHCADRGPHAYVLKPGPGAVLLGSYQADIPAAGGAGTIAVTASVPWTAIAAPWITITSGSSGTGSGTVTYNMAVNTGTSSRTGTITIAGQTFSVTQAGSGKTIQVGSAGTYSTIQLGYNNSLTGSTIEVQTATYPESNIFNSNVSVTLIGGYDSGFSTSSSNSVINGTLTISNGSVTVGNIIIQ
ncbi:MAG: BACON domain-containing carbohydrate-binding protein [Dissulfurispiraceae bacterium]